MPKTLNEQRLAQILTKVKAEDDSVRAEVSDLKSALNSHTSEITALENQVAKKADVLTSDETESDLDITDRAGNVVLRLANGGIETKNFNSTTMTQAVENLDERVEDLEEQDPVEANVDVASTTKTGVDLDVTDRTGNVLVRFASGHIQTKEFDSENVLQSINTLSEKMWTGKKWAAVGDSLTEVNQRTTKHYHDYIAEDTGITVINLGHSGAGYYARPSDYTFRRRVNDVPLDSDVVTIFGSGNDIGKESLGDVTDTEATTLCGCINITLDNLYARMPVVQLGIITPTPWINYAPMTPGNAMELYCEAIIEICRRRSIPCLDLYHCSNLRPDDATFRQLAYSKDDGGGVHPDETGHFLIASRFKSFLGTLLM